MEKENNTQNWEEIKSEEAYRLSQAEFKGATLQALQDIRQDIQEIKQDRKIKGYISYVISAVVALIASHFDPTQRI